MPIPLQFKIDIVHHCMRHRATLSRFTEPSISPLRDDALLAQLVMLTSQTASSLTDIREHNAEICELLKSMLKQQNTLIELQTEVVNEMIRQKTTADSPPNNGAMH